MLKRKVSMSLTSHGHCKSSCSLLLRTQTFARGARPALGRYHQADTARNIQVVLSVCRKISKHTEALDCVEIVHNSDTADVECAFYICPAWLPPSPSWAAGFTVVLPLRAAPSPKQTPTEHMDLFDNFKSLRSWGYSQPLILQCRMHVHKACPACPLPFETLSLSAFLRHSSQPKCRMSRDSNYSQSCQTLSGEQPLGTILNCHYFLCILTINILVSYVTAQNIFFCSREANCVAPSCFCHD